MPSRGQCHADQPAAAAQRPERLFERRGRGGQRDGDVDPPELTDRGYRVGGAGVDHVIGPEFGGQGQLLLLHVDADDDAADDPRVLHGQMAQPADTEYPDPLTGGHMGGLDRRERRHPGAGERGSVQRRHRVGHGHDEPLVGHRVLGVGAVYGVAAVLLRLTQRLPPGDAVATRPHADPSQAIATRSPTRRTAGPGPTCSMIPTPSCPGTNGGWGFTGQSPCAAWMSVWQIPQVCIRTNTCPGPGSGTGSSRISSGAASAGTTAALMVVIGRVLDPVRRVSRARPAARRVPPGSLIPGVLDPRRRPRSSGRSRTPRAFWPFRGGRRSHRAASRRTPGRGRDLAGGEPAPSEVQWAKVVDVARAQPMETAPAAFPTACVPCRPGCDLDRGPGQTRAGWMALRSAPGTE